MKHIQLTATAYLNGGRVAEAGAVVSVGDAAGEISLARAEHVIACEIGVEVDVVDDGEEVAA